MPIDSIVAFDNCTVRDVENRKRIQDLLALTKPVSQEVTYFRDAKPRVISQSPGTAGDQQQPGNVIRTIYLPNNRSVQHLESIIESLKKRLLEMVTSYTTFFVLDTNHFSHFSSLSWTKF